MGRTLEKYGFYSIVPWWKYRSTNFVVIEPFTFFSRGQTSKAEHTLPLHYLSECISRVGILKALALHGFCFQWGQGAADKETMFSTSENPTEWTPDIL